MRVLKNDGNLFMLNYPQQNAHLRVKYLDLYFPNIHEYVWVYNTNVGHTPKRFTTAHRSIFACKKKMPITNSSRMMLRCLTKSNRQENPTKSSEWVKGQDALFLV